MDDAVGLTLRLLRAHHGVAQDDHALDGAGEFLTREVIEAGIRGERPAFLDGLRSRLLW